MQVTTFVPIGKVLPEGGELITVPVWPEAEGL